MFDSLRMNGTMTAQELLLSSTGTMYRWMAFGLVCRSKNGFPQPLFCTIMPSSSLISLGIIQKTKNIEYKFQGHLNIFALQHSLNRRTWWIVKFILGIFAVIIQLREHVAQLSSLLIAEHSTAHTNQFSTCCSENFDSCKILEKIQSN